MKDSTFICYVERNVWLFHRCIIDGFGILQAYTYGIDVGVEEPDDMEQISIQTVTFRKQHFAREMNPPCMSQEVNFIFCLGERSKEKNMA